jgi:hypothetical protein
MCHDACDAVGGELAEALSVHHALGAAAASACAAVLNACACHGRAAVWRPRARRCSWHRAAAWRTRACCCVGHRAARVVGPCWGVLRLGCGQRACHAGSRDTSACFARGWRHASPLIAFVCVRVCVCVCVCAARNGMWWLPRTCGARSARARPSCKRAGGSKQQRGLLWRRMEMPRECVAVVCACSATMMAQSRVTPTRVVRAACARTQRPCTHSRVLLWTRQ